MKKLIFNLKQFLYANETIMGMNRRNIEYVKELNKRRDFPLADDKILAKEFFTKIGIPTAETIKIIDGLYEVTDFHNKFEPTDFVIKPSCGSQGKGIIIVIDKTVNGYVKPSGTLISTEEMEYELASILFGKYSLGRSDRILIEKRLVPVDEFKDLSVNGLFDIRIIVVKSIPVAVMLRLPTMGSGGKANLHQGGIGAGVDIVSGKTISAVRRGSSLLLHPDTQAPLIGFQVPYWSEILQITKHIGKHSPLGYIGVDLTIDKQIGPAVLEFNARPGLGIQSANQKGLQTLLKEAIEHE